MKGHCRDCLFWGLPYARRADVCAKEGSPHGDEETKPDQGCDLFEQRKQRCELTQYEREIGGVIVGGGGSTGKNPYIEGATYEDPIAHLNDDGNVVIWSAGSIPAAALAELLRRGGLA